MITIPIPHTTSQQPGRVEFGGRFGRRALRAPAGRLRALLAALAGLAAAGQLGADDETILSRSTGARV